MPRILMLMVVGLLAGCTVGQGVIAPGATANMWQGTGTKSGPGTFVTEKCPRSKTCTTVTVSNVPPGIEAHSYVFKLKHRAISGIPYGEEPITVYVIGDQTECDKHASAHNPEKGNFHLSADPAERCAGPVWIRGGSEHAIPSPAPTSSTSPNSAL